MVAHDFNQGGLKIHHTIHALKRGVERGVTEAEIEAMIHTGTRRLEPGVGERGGEMWLFFKTIRGRRMVAVTEILQPDCFVITIKPE